MTAAETVAWALAQVGTHETPWGSNRVPYWTDVLPTYQGGAWCGAFAWDALRHGGANLSWTTVRRFVYTPWGLADAKAAKIFYTGTPAPGDVVWFNLDTDPGPEHVGIVVAPGPVIHTVEGNVADQVKTLTRPASQIIGYAHIDYPEPDVQLTDTVRLGAYTTDALAALGSPGRTTMTVEELFNDVLGRVLESNARVDQIAAQVAILAQRPTVDVDELAHALSDQLPAVTAEQIRQAFAAVVPDVRLTIAGQ